LLVVGWKEQRMGLGKSIRQSELVKTLTAFKEVWKLVIGAGLGCFYLGK
jgi:hypothetical protein